MYYNDKRGKSICCGLIYLVIFIVSIFYLFSQTTAIKGIKKIEVIFGILILYFICLILGIFIGNLAGNIFAEKNHIFDPGVGHTLAMTLETITFIPGIICIYLEIYKKKRISKLLTIISMLVTISIFQIAFFLLLITA